EPAACSTTYLPAELVGPGATDPAEPLPDGLTVLPLSAPPAPADAGGPISVRAGQPRALHVEMQPPPPAVARSLRLPAGQPATIVTVRFDDPATGQPVAL